MTAGLLDKSSSGHIDPEMTGAAMHIAQKPVAVAAPAIGAQDGAGRQPCDGPVWPIPTAIQASSVPKSGTGRSGDQAWLA